MTFQSAPPTGGTLIHDGTGVLYAPQIAAGPTEPWTPAEITTGMFGWWDASDAASLTFSGSNLTQWSNQAAAVRHLVRAAGSGPTLTSLNGLGALAFVPGQGMCIAGTTQFNDFTACGVFISGGASPTYQRIVDHGYDTGWWTGRAGSTATWGGGVMEAGPPYGRYVALAESEPHQISAMRSGTAHTIRGNGGAVTQSGTVTATQTGAVRVTVGDNNTNDAPMTGTIAEVLVWSRALTTDELQKTEGYLAHKWGIEAKLPGGHPYKGAPPVAGPFLPSSLLGLAVWHDAADLGLADGANVAAWPNKGSGNPVSIVGTPLPTYKTAVTPGGGNAVRFAGDGAGLRGNNASIYSPGNAMKHTWTMLYVARRWGSLGGRCFTAPYPEGENVLIGYHTGGYDCMHQPMGWIKAPTAFGGSPPDPWKLYSATDQESVGVHFYINGVDQAGLQVVSAALNYYYNINGYFIASGGANSSAGEGGDFDVCELLIYDRCLTLTERVEVEDYLRAKWGL